MVVEVEVETEVAVAVKASLIACSASGVILQLKRRQVDASPRQAFRSVLFPNILLEVISHPSMKVRKT